MSEIARSSASTRAAQLSLSCSSGGTVREPGNSAASRVCQWSAHVIAQAGDEQDGRFNRERL